MEGAKAINVIDHRLEVNQTLTAPHGIHVHRLRAERVVTEEELVVCPAALSTRGLEQCASQGMRTAVQGAWTQGANALVQLVHCFLASAGLARATRSLGQRVSWIGTSQPGCGGSTVGVSAP